MAERLPTALIAAIKGLQGRGLTLKCISRLTNVSVSEVNKIWMGQRHGLIRADPFVMDRIANAIYPQEEKRSSITFIEEVSPPPEGAIITNQGDSHVSRDAAR